MCAQEAIKKNFSGMNIKKETVNSIILKNNNKKYLNFYNF